MGEAMAMSTASCVVGSRRARVAIDYSNATDRHAQSDCLAKHYAQRIEPLDRRANDPDVPGPSVSRHLNSNSREKCFADGGI